MKRMHLDTGMCTGRTAPCEAGVMLPRAKELPGPQRGNTSFLRASGGSTTLLRPWSWTSSLWHCDTITLLIKTSSPWSFVAAVLGNNTGVEQLWPGTHSPSSGWPSPLWLSQLTGQDRFNKFLSQQSPYTALLWEVCLIWGWFKATFPLGRDSCAPQLWAWWERATGPCSLCSPGTWGCCGIRNGEGDQVFKTCYSSHQEADLQSFKGRQLLVFLASTGQTHRFPGQVNSKQKNSR